jgi:RNase P/RNase MRP subunit POP5
MVRFKYRYLLAELIFINQDQLNPRTTSEGQLINLIRESIMINLGSITAGEIINQLQIKYFNPKTNLLLFKVNRSSLVPFWSALTLIRRLPTSDSAVIITVKAVSGTMRKIQYQTIKFNNISLLKALSTLYFASSCVTST